MTVILGIDPGSRKTGFGVIRVERNQAQYVSSGTIRLPVKEALGPRLRVLFESLSAPNIGLLFFKNATIVL